MVIIKIKNKFMGGRKMREIVIASAVRTPIGSFGGMFKNVSAVQLGTVVAKEL